MATIYKRKAAARQLHVMFPYLKFGDKLSVAGIKVLGKTTSGTTACGCVGRWPRNGHVDAASSRQEICLESHVLRTGNSGREDDKLKWFERDVSSDRRRNFV